MILEDVTVEFGDGLNLLTGETGAGKSILVDALGLAVGARADRSLVRSGSERAVVEALFQVPADSPADRWLQESGAGDADGGEVLVRREVAGSGNHRISINGSPCTQGMLRELGARMFELHGQHEHQSLLSPERHLELLDRFGGHGPLLEGTAETHRTYRELEDRLEELRDRSERRRERMHELEQGIRKIEALDPQPGELEQLDRERRVLQSSARMTELLDRVVGGCYEGESAAAATAAIAGRGARELAGLDPQLAEAAERLEAAAVELQDVGEFFRDYRDGRDFDPDRLESLEARRAALSRLCLEYGEDEEALLEWRKTAVDQLDQLRNVAEELKQAEERLGRAGEAYRQVAEELGRARRESAARMLPAVASQFARLALDKAEIDMVFTPARGPAVGNGEHALPLAPRGAEKGEFLLAANPGEPMQPLARVGSGGELSRILLALHAAVGDAGDGRVLVFDEVDSGVGGAVADAVGARLALLARRHQVLCITHLPQVAAHARHHLRVSKQTRGGRTRTRIQELSWEERVEELARMLGGKQKTEASRRHASEMLAATGQHSMEEA